MRQFHIVILKEKNLTYEFRLLRYFVNALDQALSGAIGGMRLAGKDKLDGVIGVVDNLFQTFEIAKQQVGALIRSKAAREADQERVGANLVEQRNDTRRVALILEPAFTEAVADILNEAILKTNASIPNHSIRNFVNAFPISGITLVFHKVGIKVFLKDSPPLVSNPRGKVNAVCNVANVALFRKISAPNTVKHLSANFAVELANAVYLLTCFTQERGHTELLSVIFVIHSA